jgi:hypothetical protein
VEQGLHFLVDVVIVLTLRGGTKSGAWHGKRRARGEVRAKTIHGLQGIWGVAKDVSPEGGEVFESAPDLQSCMKRRASERSEMSTCAPDVYLQNVYLQNVYLQKVYFQNVYLTSTCKMSTCARPKCLLAPLMATFLPLGVEGAAFVVYQLLRLGQLVGLQPSVKSRVLRMRTVSNIQKQ